MNSQRLVFATLISLATLIAGAAEIEFNPGNWETIMTRTNPMTGEPITETRTECVKERKFNPASMMQGTDGCDLIEDSLDGDTLSFQMECGMQGGQATIEGQFQTDGETGKGDMDMSINAGGMNMKMNMNWTAKRVGDC
jgi:hypothetical protein